MEELNKTNANPDEWDAMAEQQAEDFERNITGSWGSPSPSDTEGRQ